MPLNEEDIREILRLIDESDLEELQIESGDLSLHVVRGEAAATAAAAEPESADTDGAAPGDLLTITAPMLGTFYRASAPGADPFVDVGARVEPDTVVCLIEVMKMMNSIPAGVGGTIVEICVENAELVEHGADLFKVRSD